MINENFVQVLEGSIKNNWELPAFSDYKGTTLTYGDVARRILHLHYLFEKLHVEKGDKISLLGRNSSHWAVVYLATVMYGAVIVPVLPDFHIDDFHHIVNHSDSVLLFVADAIYEKIDETRMTDLVAAFSLTDFSLLYSKKKTTVKVVEKVNAYVEEKQGQWDTVSFSMDYFGNDQLAGIIYTSGTSGFSKGVMLPHNSLIANVRFARNNIALKCGDTLLSFLPLAHAFGCAFDFLFPFSLGCHITFLGQIPSPKILVQALAQVKPRLILTVPLVIEKVYKSRVKPKLEKSAVKILSLLPGLGGMIHKKIRAKLIEAFGGNFIEVVIGGAALNEEVETFLKKIKFPFTCGYGMTECGPLISYTSFLKGHRKGSVGRVVDTLEIRIDKSVTDMEGENGEIQVKGENVMVGYYKNEEATRETIGEDGWLHTGDIGVIDRDGFVYIKGRHKSMLLGPAGENIYPEEIEARLNNLPYVEESLVLEREKKLVALVYPNVEAVDASGLDEKALLQKMEENRIELNRQIPLYSRVIQIELYPEEFEKTPTKKIKRFLYMKMT